MSSSASTGILDRRQLLAELGANPVRMYIHVGGSYEALETPVRVVHLREGAVRIDVGAAHEGGLPLNVGQEVHLGYGRPDRSMYFVCAVEVLEVRGGGTEVVCTAPSEPEKLPRRRHARAPMELVCRVTTLLGGSFEGVTENVSASGALVCVPRGATSDNDSYEVGSLVDLSMNLPSGITMKCRAHVVRRVEEEGTPVLRAIAVAYDNLPELAEMRLQYLVLRTVARRAVRVRMAHECELRLGEGDSARCIQGVTENVSGIGMLVQCAERTGMPEVGTRVDVNLLVSQRQIVLRRASVVRVELDAHAGMRLSLDYSALPEHVREPMVALVHRRLRDV